MIPRATGTGAATGTALHWQWHSQAVPLTGSLRLALALARALLALYQMNIASGNLAVLDRKNTDMPEFKLFNKY